MQNNEVKTIFDNVFNFIKNNRIIFLVLFFALIAGSAIHISRQRFINDVSVMLPDSPELKRTLNFINNSDMSDTIAFSITGKGDSDINLFLETDAFADQLKNLEFITNVTTGIEDLDITTMKKDIALLLPFLLDKDDYQLFEEVQNPEKLSQRIKQMFIMLTTPGSSFLQNSIGIDPLSWSDIILSKLQVLSKSMGFDVELKNNHFVDRTHRHTLIVAKTSVPVTDADRSEKMLSAVDLILESFPDLDVTIVCGHKHTLSNQKVVKKDVYITTVIITLSFILLMLFTFRTFDALTIFILPFFAIIISVFVSSFLMNTLSYFMIGFAAVIAGISVDYGIHLFTAYKTKGYIRFKKTIKPVLIASLSTMGVFVSFFISSVQGYKELAVFSILSIIICVILSIIFLPHFWIKKDLITKIKIPADLSLNKSRMVLLSWGVIFILSIICMTNSDFLKATDVAAFDGSEQKVFDAEERFHKIWGGDKKPGVIVTTGIDMEAAWKDYELITKKLKNDVKGFNSFALILPSLQQQKKNLKNFQKYWSDNRVEQFKNIFLKNTSSYGFKENIFDDFFALLSADNIKPAIQIPDILKIFEKHFVRNNETVNLLSYFNDSEGDLAKVESILKEFPDSYVVSRRELSSQIGKQLIFDLKNISIFAFCWVFVLIMILLRKPSLILLSLLPVVTSLSFVFLILTITGIEVSAIILITLIIILGLSLDYGVFISSAESPEDLESVVIATTFSMLTSLMGAGALLFAQHPIMFSIGTTIVSGVTAAYLSAVFCIPAFKKVLK